MLMKEKLLGGDLCGFHNALKLFRFALDEVTKLLNTHRRRFAALVLEALGQVRFTQSLCHSSIDFLQNGFGCRAWSLAAQLSQGLLKPR